MSFGYNAPGAHKIPLHIRRPELYEPIDEHIL